MIMAQVDEKFIQNIVSIIEKNLGDFDFSIESLGKEIGLSRSQLFRKFKALTNESPMEFIQLVRLEHAKRLLQTTSLTITEISYKVGFNYPNNFAKIFQKRLGSSPSEFRKKYKVTSQPH